MIVHVTDLVKILTDSFSSQVFSFYVIEEQSFTEAERAWTVRSKKQSSIVDSI